MIPLAVFDLNVRVGHDLTYVGFEDLFEGDIETLNPGDSIKLLEVESDSYLIGTVWAIAQAEQLIYIHVDWSQVRSEMEHWRTYGPVKITYLLKTQASSHNGVSKLEIKLHEGEIAWDFEHQDWLFGPRKLVYTRAGSSPIHIETL